MKKNTLSLVGAGILCIGYAIWLANDTDKNPQQTSRDDSFIAQPTPRIETSDNQNIPAEQLDQKKVSYLPKSISENNTPIKKEELINTLEDKLKKKDPKSLAQRNKPTLEKLNTPPPKQDAGPTFNNAHVLVNTRSRKQEAEKADMPPPPQTHQPLPHGKIQ